MLNCYQKGKTPFYCYYNQHLVATITYNRSQTPLLPKKDMLTNKTMGLQRFSKQLSTLNGYAKSLCNGFSSEDYFAQDKKNHMFTSPRSTSKENTCQGRLHKRACKIWHCSLHRKPTSSLGNQKTEVVLSFLMDNYIYEQSFNLSLSNHIKEKGREYSITC